MASARAFRPRPRPRRGVVAVLAGLAATGALVGALLPRAGGVQPPVRTTFRAVDDGYVTARKPRAGFATGTRLLVARRPLARTYLRFRVSGIGGTVSRATLRVRTVGRTGGPLVVRLVADGWRERSLSLSRAPRPRPAAAAYGGGRGWLSVDVTRLVHGSGIQSFSLTAPAGRLLLYSREAGPRFAPRLIVETPGTGGVTAGSPGTPAPGGTPPPAPSAPPPSGPTAVVAAAGDIACAPSDPSIATGPSCRQAAISDLVAASGAGAFLALGDEQYERGALDEFMGSYDTSFGRFRAITHPVPGNHEYLTADAAGYFQYFGAAAGNPLEGYYSFDAGTWHIVALNSNCARAGGCQRGSPQEQWLRADLAAHRTRCTLAFWHHPRYNSGKFGDDGDLRPIWQALVDGGAEIALAGHAHNYERFAPQNADSGLDAAHGVRQFVVGTGGANHTPIRTIRPNSEVRNDDTFGILVLTLRPTGYDWRFVPEPGGAFTDAGSDVCH